MTASSLRKLSIGVSFSILLMTANVGLALDVGDRAPAFSAPALDGKGMVELTVGEVTEELLAAVEAAFADELVCIDGPGPSELPPPGPQG